MFIMKLWALLKDFHYANYKLLTKLLSEIIYNFQLQLNHLQMSTSSLKKASFTIAMMDMILLGILTCVLT